MYVHSGLWWTSVPFKVYSRLTRMLLGCSWDRLQLPSESDQDKAVKDELGFIKLDVYLGIPSENQITCKWKCLSRLHGLVSIHTPFGKFIYLLCPLCNTLPYLEDFFTASVCTFLSHTLCVWCKANALALFFFFLHESRQGFISSHANNILSHCKTLTWLITATYCSNSFSAEIQTFHVSYNFLILPAPIFRSSFDACSITELRGMVLSEVM